MARASSPRRRRVPRAKARSMAASCGAASGASGRPTIALTRRSPRRDKASGTTPRLRLDPGRWKPCVGEANSHDVLGHDGKKQPPRRLERFLTAGAPRQRKLSGRASAGSSRDRETTMATPRPKPSIAEWASPEPPAGDEHRRPPARGARPHRDARPLHRVDDEDRLHRHPGERSAGSSTS